MVMTSLSKSNYGISNKKVKETPEDSLVNNTDKLESYSEYDVLDEFLFEKVEEETEKIIKNFKKYGLIIEYIQKSKDRAFEEDNLLLAEFYDTIEQEVKLKVKELNFE